MSSFTAEPGDTVRIELKRRQRKKQVRTGAPEQVRGITAVDPEANRYIRRSPKTKAIAIYDLGLRLRSVLTDDLDAPLGLRVRQYPVHDSQSPGEDKSDEYVEIPLEVKGTYLGDDPAGAGVYGSFSVSGAEWLKLQSMLLGSLRKLDPGETRTDDTDPTAFAQANGSSRQIPHCPVVGIVHVRIGTQFFSYTASMGSSQILPDGSGTSTELTPNFDQDTAEGDESERWNTISAEEGTAFLRYKLKDEDFFKSFAGSLAMFENFYLPDSNFGVKGSPFHIDTGDTRVQTPGFGLFGPLRYYPFDTASPHCKVTSEPDYTAPVVTFNFTGEDNRIYIRPVVAGHTLRNGASALVTWVQRNAPGYASNISCYVRRSAYAGGFFDGATDLVKTQPLSLIDPDVFAQLLIPAGQLLAIIARKTSKFYIWSAVDFYSDLTPQSFGVTPDPCPS